MKRSPASWTGLSASSPESNRCVMRITAILARVGALIVCVVLSLIAFAIAQPDDPPLLVLKTGLGSGTVSGTGINCGFDCDASLASTDTVTLTAAAPAGSSFTGSAG